MKAVIQTILSLSCYTFVAGFLSPCHKTILPIRMPTVDRTLNMIMPDYESTSLLISEETKDYGEFVKSIFIVLLFGGGYADYVGVSFNSQYLICLLFVVFVVFPASLIPAAIGANAAMLKTLSGKKEVVDVDATKTGDSFDPTIQETKYRAYVATGVGADGPSLPFSSLLFASDPVQLVDIIAIVS